jgi:hypothetical protein
MKEFLNKNFQFIIIVGLALLLFFNRTLQPTNVPQPTITIQSDTSWKAIIAKITQSQPPSIVNTIPYPVEKLEPIYIPDTNYQRLKVQFEELRDKYLATNIQKDSLKIDTIGYVHVTDSVQKNQIVGRSYEYKLKYPTITNTITIREPYKPKRQLYLGGSIGGVERQSGQLEVNEIGLGLLYKNKKDQQFGAKVNYNFGEGLGGEISSYWKIGKRK